MDNNLNDTLNSLRQNSSYSGNTYHINYYYNYNSIPQSVGSNLRINDRVIAKWDRGRHTLYNGWYYGRITGINENRNYRILFDDGFTDTDVPEENIRFISRQEHYRETPLYGNETDRSSNTQRSNYSSNTNRRPNYTSNTNRRYTNSLYSPLNRRSSVLVGSNPLRRNYSNRTSIDNPFNLFNNNAISQTSSPDNNTRNIRSSNINEEREPLLNIINNTNTDISPQTENLEQNIINTENDDSNLVNENNSETTTSPNNLSTIYEESINSITEQLEETINQIYQNINTSTEMNNNFQAILEISRVRNRDNGVSLAQLNIASELISINPSNIDTYEQERCAICNEDFVINEVIRKLNTCPHFFHYNCIDTWFTNNDTCPICRRNVNDYSPARITYGESNNQHTDNSEDNVNENNDELLPSDDDEYSNEYSVDENNNDLYVNLDNDDSN